LSLYIKKGTLLVKRKKSKKKCEEMGKREKSLPNEMRQSILVNTSIFHSLGDTRESLVMHEGGK
jgi:tartrate dehydratase beta subunit/fumarate hydratase class I family protein